ncbi:MAG: HAD-IA family hydrolase [Oscillospiraceae bacterium]
MIEAVLFDVMGVILTEGDDVQNLLIPYVGSLLSDVDPAFIRRRYIAASLGNIDGAQFWREIGFAEEQIPAVEATYLEACFRLNPEVLPCLESLSVSYRLALLSNDVSAWSAFLREHHGYGAFMERAFISGDLGMRKPDPAIYTHVLREMGLEANACLFIDDDPRRVEAARELGITGLLFDPHSIHGGYRGLRIQRFPQLGSLLT